MRLEANNWSNYNEDLLVKLFDQEPAIRYTRYHYRQRSAKEIRSIIDNSLIRIHDWFKYETDEFRSEMMIRLSSLEGIRERLELFDELTASTLLTQSSDSVSDKPVSNPGDDVFVVHGHDEAAKSSTVDFVKTFDLNPIILDENANEGQTIIEKFEANARKAGYAIILLTPDDVGATKDKANDLNPRARQNVILELGYFLGALGRDRVCVLHKDKVEPPSDIHGIIYVPMDSNNGWKLKLAQEMEQAGLPVDLNKLLK